MKNATISRSAVKALVFGVAVLAFGAVLSVSQAQAANFSVGGGFSYNGGGGQMIGRPVYGAPIYGGGTGTTCVCYTTGANLCAGGGPGMLPGLPGMHHPGVGMMPPSLPPVMPPPPPPMAMPPYVGGPGFGGGGGFMPGPGFGGGGGWGPGGGGGFMPGHGTQFPGGICGVPCAALMNPQPVMPVPGGPSILPYPGPHHGGGYQYAHGGGGLDIGLSGGINAWEHDQGRANASIIGSMGAFGASIRSNVYPVAFPRQPHIIGVMPHGPAVSPGIQDRPWLGH